MTQKLKCAIIGSGNIGTDLMMKLFNKGKLLELVAVVGIDPESEGLSKARALGLEAIDKGIDGLVASKHYPDIKIVFDAIFGSLARWTGAHIFHISGTLARNSVLDTRYCYLVLLVVLVASIVLTIVWTLLDHSSRSTRTASSIADRRASSSGRLWIARLLTTRSKESSAN